MVVYNEIQVSLILSFSVVHDEAVCVVYFVYLVTAKCSLLFFVIFNLYLIDELFKYFVLFTQRCLSSGCYLVRSVASYSIMSSLMQSSLVHFCKLIVLICFHFQTAIGYL